MEKTDYILNEENGLFSVDLNGQVVAKGCITKNDALHAIWTKEGKVQDDFYVADEAGNVSRVDSGVL